MAAAPSASAIRALALEYKSLSEDPVEGFRVKLLNEEDMFVWEVALFGPPDTLYQGGYFKVNINPARSFLPAVSCVLWVNSVCSHARCNAHRSSLYWQCAQPECDLRHGPQQQQQQTWCCCVIVVVWWRLAAGTQTHVPCPMYCYHQAWQDTEQWSLFSVHRLASPAPFFMSTIVTSARS